MMVAPSGIRTEARGPTALMRDPLTTITASGSGGPPFPSMTAQPTMASVAGWEPVATVAMRLTISARPGRDNDFILHIDLIRLVNPALPRRATLEMSQGFLSRRCAEIPGRRHRWDQSESGKYRTRNSVGCA